MSLGLQAQFYEVTYESFNNGQRIENQDSILLKTSKEGAIITTLKSEEKSVKFPSETTWFKHQKSNELHLITALDAETSIATLDTVSLRKYDYELVDETRKILGYLCKKAITRINSNTITLWYTTELPVYGGPNTLGNHLGLILGYDRNGTFAIEATKVIQKKKASLDFHSLQNVSYHELLTYRDLVWKSRFITLKVFENQQINFDPNNISHTEEVFRYAAGTVVAKKINFPEIEKGSQVFVDASIQSNGDAYDRTASVVAIPVHSKTNFKAALDYGIDVLPIFENDNGKKYQGVVSTTDYEVPLELMRLFTTFGIKHFDHITLKDKDWHKNAPYRQDITELSPALSAQEVWIVMFVGNYDKGGHTVNLNITIHPSTTQYFKSDVVLPVFNTTNLMEMAGQEYATMFSSDKGLTASFVVEKPIKNAYLRYIATGHGGWSNGDEFLPKVNTIVLNGAVKHQFIPWRQDCGSYRLFNPASGNFSNGLSSSDYSRSNWCPGMVTNPEFIYIGDLEIGTHTIDILIPQGQKEGGSFSAWNVSGTIFGTLED